MPYAAVRAGTDRGGCRPERVIGGVGIRRGDTVPAKRVQIRGEPLRRIEAAAGDGIPRLARDNLRVQLALPEDLEGLPLGVVVDTGQPNQRGVPRIHRRDYLFNKIEALANRYDLTKLGCGTAYRHLEYEAFLAEKSLYRFLAAWRIRARAYGLAATRQAYTA